MFRMYSIILFDLVFKFAEHFNEQNDSQNDYFYIFV